jgi:pyruvate dehydrogenase E1 component beta subunit
MDLETVVASVRKTHRLVIAHEAVLSGGWSAELAARVQEVAFDELDAPILRVGAPHAPVPASPPLEERYLPSRERLVETVLAVTGRTRPG